MAKKKYLCKECGKAFDNFRALGGHVLNSHRSGDQVEVHEPSAVEEPGEAEKHEPSAVEEPGEAEQVRYYLDQGIDFDSLTKRMGFSVTTVRREEAKRIKQGKVQDTLPATYKATEVVSPEALLRRCLDGSRDDELELRGMMKLRAAMLLVGELTDIQKKQAEVDAHRIKPILELMKETRLEQDAAAARAKESSVEIAERAAYEGAKMLADQMMPEVRALKSQAAAGPELDPVTRMLNTLQAIPRLIQVSQQLTGMMGMPMPGTPSPQQPQASHGMQSQQPAGLGPQPVTKDEIKEAFGDR